MRDGAPGCGAVGRRWHTRGVRIALLVTGTALAAALLTGCGTKTSASSAPPTSTPTTTAAATGTTTAAGAPRTALTIYPVRDGVVRPEHVDVPATTAVAAAALRALGLDGASVTIADGTATVAGTQPTADQVAAIVYTLTQFPSVERVDVAGRTGLTRADVADYAPLILIDAPAAGATVPADVHVIGSAVVYEATLVVELVRDGKVLERRTVTASAGAPERGTFETTLHAPSPGATTVVAFSPSAEDGSPQHEVDVPITVAG
jgi:hypothetical protein